jgi:hypothetical protein
MLSLCGINKHPKDIVFMHLSKLFIYFHIDVAEASVEIGRRLFPGKNRLNPRTKNCTRIHEFRNSSSQRESSLLN